MLAILSVTGEIGSPPTKEVPLRALRRYNALAYRQPRWHLVDGEGTLAICGTDVAKVTGDRRGAVGAGTIREARDLSALSEYAICGRCRTKRDGGATGSKLTAAESRALFRRAAEAARAAAEAVTPTPMIVGEPVNLLASMTGGDDGGFREDRPVYRVNEGVCGIGSLNIKPANSSFANWLRKNGHGSTDSYAGGLRMSLWALDVRTQSYERLSTAARAAVAVLREAGINAVADVRID